MGRRADASGISCNEQGAAGVNGGRIGEIATGAKFARVKVAPSSELPPLAEAPHRAARSYSSSAGRVPAVEAE